MAKWDGKRLVLVLLYAPGATERVNEPIRGRTRLTKFLFVFEKEIWRKFRFSRMIGEDELPEFFAWHYGPFSKDAFNDIEFLVQLGFVEARRNLAGTANVEEAEEFHWWEEDILSEYETHRDPLSEYEEEEFRLAELGLKFLAAKGLWDDLDDEQKRILSDYKRRFNSLPLNAILKYVYEKYPDMAEKSKIRENV